MNTPTVKGTTRLYLIVGDPIVQGKSPETFTDRCQRAGFDAMLLPVDLKSAGVIAVKAAERPNAVRREKFLFVEEIPQEAFQAVP